MQEKRYSKSVLWLGPIILGWGGLIVLAHQTTEWAIIWTTRLFGWMLLLTYVFLWGWVIGISRKPRRTLLGGVTCTITILMILIFLELPALLGIVHWDLVIQRLTGDLQNLTWAYRHDRELEFRRRPNDHWIGRPSRDIEHLWLMPRSILQPLSFTYDRRGYRNTTTMKQGDVALIGDSYVEGWNVSDDETTGSRLQARLDRPVINLGVAGYGPQQEFLVLKRDGMDLQPKVVVWFFFEGNDLYDDHRFENFLLADPRSPKELVNRHFGLAFDQEWKQRLFTLASLNRLRRWSAYIIPSHAPYFGHLNQPGQEKTTIYFSDYAAIPWTEWEADRWNKAKGTLEKVAEFSNTHEIKILFVFVPIKFRVYKSLVTLDPDSPCHQWKIWPIAQLFSEFCQSARVPCLDLTSLFRQSIQEGKMPYAAADTHWGPEGHDLVAGILASELDKRGWFSAIH